MAEQLESDAHKRYPIILLILYAAVWIWAAINPVYPHDWWLENILVFAAVPLFIWSYYKFRLSNVSYTLIFVFMCLHSVGSHYTYAEVPLGFWLQNLFHFSRNHFDRIVHFSYGFLLAYPVREIFLRIASTKGFWGYWLPFELTLAFSCLYELMEWGIAEVVSPGAGSAFLGSQGDPWDAQKDMALAGLGALLSMTVIAIINWRYDLRFSKEMKASFKVKEPEPLGEVKLAELKEEREEHELKHLIEQEEQGLKPKPKRKAKKPKRKKTASRPLKR